MDIVENGARNFNQIAIAATLKGHLDIVKYAFSNKARVINKIALIASENGYYKIISYAIKNGANNFIQILENAQLNKHEFYKLVMLIYAKMTLILTIC